MGSVEEKIIEQAIEKDLEIPDRIVNQPVLMLGLELYYIAFTNLSSDRLLAFELGPIPTMAILAYASYYDITGVDASDFLYIIRSMDNAFIQYHDKKQKAEAAKEARRAKKRK